MAIDLILRKDVPSLGRMGDVVKVAPGYARNYLIPKGLALQVTPDNLKRLEAEKVKTAKLRELELVQIRELAKRLAGSSCTVAVKANEEGHLYGSVDARLIAEAFAKDGVELEAKVVALEEPIKELGVYTVGLRLAPEVECETKVWVVEDKGDGTVEAPPEEPEGGEEA